MQWRSTASSCITSLFFGANISQLIASVSKLADPVISNYWDAFMSSVVSGILEVRVPSLVAVRSLPPRGASVWTMFGRAVRVGGAGG